MTRALAILAYHKVGEPPRGGWSTWNYVPEATFLAQIGVLHAHGFEVVTLDAAVAALADPEALPARPALLTFDDGCFSLREIVAPLLERERLPWTVFVPTDHVGGHNAFDHGSEPHEPILGWEDLRALNRQGVTIASHAASHRAFSDLTADELRSECERSRAVLERELGHRVRALAFPYGDAGRDPAVTSRLLAECGYGAAVLYKGGGALLPASSPFLLPRIAMGPDTDLAAELEAVSRLSP